MSNYGVGQIYVIGLASLLTPDLEAGRWRLLLVLAALPSAAGIIMLFSKVVESPMFSAKKGLNQAAIGSLDYIAGTNNKNQVTEKEKTQIKNLEPPNEERGFCNLRVLFDSAHRFTTLLLMGQWALTTFLYFGFFYLLPQLLRGVDSEISTFWLMSLVVVSEMLVTTSTAWLVELPSLGRKGTMKVFYGVLVFASGLCLFVTDNYVLVAAVVVISAFNQGSFCILWTYTPEVYETQVRGMSVAFLNITARAIDFFAPFVFGHLLKAAVWVPFLLVLVLGVGLVTIVFFLPVETRGISLDTKPTNNT